MIFVLHSLSECGKIQQDYFMIPVKPELTLVILGIAMTTLFMLIFDFHSTEG